MCHIAPSKIVEGVAEGEDKETDDSEEKTVVKPPGKEEAETPELKVETPELKVSTVFILLTMIVIMAI